MATVLWCYLRNNAFKKDKDYHLSADLTGQANHLGVTIEADIIKQKLPENNGGYQSAQHGRFQLRQIRQAHLHRPCQRSPDRSLPLSGCELLHGPRRLINSGGASGANDFEEAVATAVINKRAGGTGLISGRKAFQRPMNEGVKLLNTIQDVYLSPEVTVA